MSLKLPRPPHGDTDTRHRSPIETCNPVTRWHFKMNGCTMHIACFSKQLFISGIRRRIPARGDQMLACDVDRVAEVSAVPATPYKGTCAAR